MAGTKTILPIIGNQDVQNVIGILEKVDGKAIMRFEEPIPKSWLPEGAYIVRETKINDGKEYISEVELLAISINTYGKRSNKN